MLSVLNNYAHGFVSIPVLIACKRHGLFTFLEEKGACGFSDLAGELNANKGYLRVALNILESLGWVVRDLNDEYSLSDSYQSHHDIPEDIVQVVNFPMQEYFSGSTDEVESLSLKNWFDQSLNQWSITDTMLIEFIDGVIYVPLFVSLCQHRETLGLEPTVGKTDVSIKGVSTNNLFASLNETAKTEIVDHLIDKKLLSREGGTLEYTDKGRFLQDRALNMAMVYSYHPMLTHIGDVIFSRRRFIGERDEQGHELHVDRTLNVLASGFSHTKYFTDLEATILSIFNNTDFSRQPKYIADMGCGDGSLLKVVFDVIRDKSERGKVLEQYPLVLIGADYNDKALNETEKTLRAYPHIVIPADIGDPAQLVTDLKAQGIKDTENILHVRSFLDHDRPYIAPLEDHSGYSRLIDKDLVYVDNDGGEISPAVIIQSLVEHFKRWSSIIGKHGLLILEVHRLNISTVNQWTEKTESLHFDAYHCFSQQLLVNAPLFYKSAAEAGLYSNLSCFRKYPKTLPYARITLNYFQSRDYQVRQAHISDLPAIVHIEAQCWTTELRTDEKVLKQRLNRYPEGQFVLLKNGEVLGVTFSQLLSDKTDLDGVSINDIDTLHQPDGSVAQLLGVNILPSVQDRGYGDQLLEFRLQLATLTPGITSIVGITRCKDYHKHTDIEYSGYVSLRTPQGRLLDTVLRFHEAHGAKIGKLYPNYRPTDTVNQEYGVLVEYVIDPRQRQNACLIEQRPLLEPIKTQEKPAVDKSLLSHHVTNAVLLILGLSNQTVLNHEQPLMELGLDSADLLELNETLSTQFELTLDSTFFFEYNTISRVVNFLSQQSFSATCLEEYQKIPKNVVIDSVNIAAENAVKNIAKIVDQSEVKDTVVSAEIRHGFSEKVAQAVALILGVNASSEIVTDQPLMELGLDSADLLELNETLSTQFNIALESTFFFEFNTVDRITEFLSLQQSTLLTEKAQQKIESRNQDSEVYKPSNKNALISQTVSQQHRPSDEANKKGDVAIVGISCRLPGNINNSNDLWKVLSDNIDTVGLMPQGRMSWPMGIDTDNTHQGIDRGAYLTKIADFDPGFFRISAKEAEVMDPQQRLLLSLSWSCLEDAGIAADTLAGKKIGVFMGASGSDYKALSQGQSEDMDAHAGIGASMAAIPNRISYFYDFTGPSIHIDTACSSSLVAVHEAIKALNQGDCEQVLVGAINIICHPSNSISYYKAGMLSKDGKCKTFDQDANGYVRGEGAVMMLLKPLEDALADSDVIYGVIKGSAVNHGGQAGGLTVPNPKMQAEMVVDAITRAGVNATQVGYVEAHGTGTSLGDPIEIQGLKKAFLSLRKQAGENLTAQDDSCGIGSVKTNLGHLEAASGMAGLLKLILCLKHQSIPASLHFKQLNSHISLENSPFYVVDKNQPWQLPDNQLLRIGCVSSFGSGGTNAHLVVQEAPSIITKGENNSGPNTAPYLICISAKTEQALKRKEADLLQWLVQHNESGEKPSLSDISATLLSRRVHFEFRAAYIAQDMTDLMQKLTQTLRSSDDAAGLRGTVQAKTNTRHGYEQYAASILSDLAANLIIQSEAERHKKLSVIAECYLDGFALEWSLLFKQIDVSSLSLPTYPFATDSYWLPASTKKVETPRLSSSTIAVDTGHYQTQWVNIAQFPEAATLFSERHILLCEIENSAELLPKLEKKLKSCQTTILSSNPADLAQSYTDYAVMLFEYMQKIMLTKPKDAVLVQLIIPSTVDPSSLWGLSGLLKTAHLENPKLSVQLIALNDSSIGSLISTVENCAKQPYCTEIIENNGELKAKDWQRVEKPLAAASHPWKENATYLITGGAGGLGALFAVDIAENLSHVNLILTGRSDASGHEYQQKIQEQIKHLTALGATVEYKTLDVVDRQSVVDMLDYCRISYGEINGILHCAGITQDNYLVKKHRDEFLNVLPVKVNGLINLDEASRQDNLDLFIAFSSVAGATGNAGQSDYACANAFMDAYINKRASLVSKGRCSGASLSMNWPLWQDGGMQLDAASKTYFQNQLGLIEMETAQGLQAFYQGVAISASQMLVLHGNPEKTRKALLLDIETRNTHGNLSIDVGKQAGNLQDVDKKIIVDKLKKAASEELKTAVESIDENKVFNEYGFDSILLTAFINRINFDYTLDLNPTLFFEYQTISEFSSYLLNQHGHAFVEAQHGSVSNAFKSSKPVSISSVVAQDVISETVAIVGMSGSFPMADDVDQFWKNLIEEKDCISTIPASRWDWQAIYGDPAEQENTSNVKWGGFIDAIDRFDPLFFKISPREAELMDPQQRLLLSHAWQTIEDAGYSPQSLSGSNTAVYVGICSNGYHSLMAESNTALEGYSATGTSDALASNRLSFHFNFTGPSESINTACSSSLVAIHRGVLAIQQGCETALVGGVHTIVTPWNNISLNKAGMLCEDGRCKTFSAQANGYVRSEGIGLLLLKPLSAAQRDRDAIYGVIRASHENHGGRANTLTAPNPKAQEQLLVDVYTQAGVDPRQVGYIEAHGTGTKLGDPIEVNALKSAFDSLYKNSDDSSSIVTTVNEPHCGLGSVKTNVGHLEVAAGVAGVIKVLLQLKHKTLVKSLHSDELNPYIQLEKTPFYVVSKSQPWPSVVDQANNALPRIAGVSSFGIGGSNAHIVLEQYETLSHINRAAPSANSSTNHASDNRGAKLIVLSAKDNVALYNKIKQLYAVAGEYSDADLADIAYTLQVGREAMAVRFAVVVTTLADLNKKLNHVLQQLSENDNFSSELIQSDTSAGELQDVLEQWLSGAEVDWQAVNKGQNYQRLHLPTYPFANERYWIPELGTVTASEAVNQLHPLLHENISTLSQQCFCSRFTGNEFFLADHVINGEKILPGVAYLEMVRAAASLALGLGDNKIVNLEEVVWLRPFVSKTETLPLFLGLYPNNNTNVTFEIYSYPDANEANVNSENKWVHCQGVIEISEIALASSVHLDIPKLQQQLTPSALLSEDYYQAFSHIDIDYGPGHQCLNALWISPDSIDPLQRQVLAKLVIPQGYEGALQDYQLHPGMLDSALQATLGLSEKLGVIDSANGVMLPFALESLSIKPHLGSATMWAWIRYSEGANSNAPNLNIDISDERGAVCIQFKSFSSRRYSPETAPIQSGNVANLLFKPQWQVKALDKSSQNTTDASIEHTVLILGANNNEAFSDALKQRIPHASCHQYLLLSDEVASCFEQYACLTLEHVQSVLAHASKRPQLFQLVVSEQLENLGLPGLSGLLKTAEKENPGFIGQVLVFNLDLASGDYSEDLLLNRIIDNTLQIEDKEVCYRDDLRQVKAWEQIESTTLASEPMLWKSAGLYLITGGLGGLGRIFSKEIAAHCKGVSLILTGRSALDENGQAFLNELERLGATVEYHRVDMASKESVHDLIENISLLHEGDNKGISGIIHSAGIINDNYLVKKTAEELGLVFSAKVAGLINLDEATSHLSLDFFVAFSSIAATLGNAGQGDYACANGFMDQYIAYRNRLMLSGRRQGQSVSINWPLWRDGGMSIHEETEKQLLADLGMVVLESNDGIEAFYHSLASGYEQVMVVQGSHNKVKEVLASSSSSTAAFPSATVSVSSDHVVSNSIDFDNTLVEKTVTYLKSVLSQEFKLPADKIQDSTTLDQYGIDSVTVLGMTNSLEKTFGRLPKTLFFEYQTLAALSDYFVSSHYETLSRVLGLSAAKNHPEMAKLESAIVTKNMLKNDVSILAKDRFMTMSNRPSTSIEHPSSDRVDIAIVGLSGRFPQANNIDEYWHNLHTGKDCITPIPESRWDATGFYYKDKQQAISQGRSYSNWGGFISEVEHFDPLFFGISPKEAKRIDPQERIFIQEVYHCIEDAGYTPENLIERDDSLRKVGVYVGVMNGYYPSGGHFWSIANRVSYTFNFHGPSLALDTACSSSLTAIHMACESIKRGECELAIAGGVNLIVSPEQYFVLSAATMLSSDAKNKTFGANADGFVDGEAVCAMLLKPLVQAEVDHDHIYGVIKASAINAGGKTNGYTVPNLVAQSRLISEVIASAEVDPRTITYIEAHGTGTSLGDPIEIASLSKAFQQIQSVSDQPVLEQYCAIGSAKSNIGHCESAAGVAGVAKVLLQMKHKQIVPSLHSETLNPHIDFESSPFVVPQSLEQWERPQLMVDGKSIEYPRIAGVSSFGAGGANAHVIVSEYVGVDNAVNTIQNGQSIIVLSAKDKDRLAEQVNQLLLFIKTSSAATADDIGLLDIAYTLQVGRRALSHRLAVVVSSMDELESQLNAYLSDEASEVYCGEVKREDSILDALSGDNDIASVVDVWLSNGKFSKLLGLWVSGLEIDWSKLYSVGTDQPKRISLPTYPFAKESYWLEQKSHSRQMAHFHPLVHQNTSDFMQQQFSSQFTGNEFFLVDHQVNDQMLLPGVAYIEMIHFALAKAMGTNADINDVISLNRLVWLKPFTVDQKELGNNIKLALTPSVDASSGQVTFEFSDDEQSLYCRGAVSLSSAARPDRLNIEHMLSEYQPANNSADSYYAMYQEMGICYGPSFQCLKAVYVGDTQVLAQLHLPESLSSTISEFALHPALFDAALHSAIALLMESGSYLDLKAPLVPFALNHVVIYKAFTGKMWASISYSEGFNANSALHKSVQKMDLTLADENGDICVVLQGLTVRQFTAPSNAVNRIIDPASESSEPPVVTEGNNVDGHWMLKPEWVEQAIEVSLTAENILTIEPEKNRPQRYVVCTSETFLDLNTIEKLQTHGVSVVQLKSQKGNLAQRFQSYALDTFNVVKNILEKKLNHQAFLQVLIPVNQGELETPVFEALSGLVKSVCKENPKFKAQVISIETTYADDLDKGEVDQDRLFELLQDNYNAQKVQASSIDIRYEQGARWVKRWIDYQPERDVNFSYKNQGVYLITGGVGGLGAIFAKDIAEKTEDTVLVLLGRSAANERIYQEVAILEALGSRVEYCAIDVSDAVQVNSVIEHTVEQYGRLDGIVHSAGVLNDKMIINKQADEFSHVLSPKIDGLVNLDKASSQIKLDFIVAFSSITGALGNAGQSDYATANAFMDAYIHYRNTLVKKGQRYGVSLSLNWSLWDRGGMDIDVKIKESLYKYQGVKGIHSEDGLLTLRQCLSRQESQIIAVSGDLEKIKQQLFSNITPASQLLSTPVIPPKGESVAIEHSNDLGSETLQFLKEMLSTYIDLDTKKIDKHVPLAEYGVDSVTVLTMIAELEKFFGELPKTLLFEYPSLSALSDYLLAEHKDKLTSVFNVPTTLKTTASLDVNDNKSQVMAHKITTNYRLQSAPLIVQRGQNNGINENINTVTDIAIIGVSGRYPQAETIDQLWNNLRDGKDCITEIPQSRWDYTPYFDADKKKEGKTYSKWGGFIDGIEHFDPLFFNIAPGEAGLIDPQERLFLQCVYETIEDAGYTRENLSSTGNVDVYVGVMYSEYELYGHHNEQEGRGFSVPVTTASIANRISYYFDFNGASLALNTMCSSSLTALHLACQSLRNNDCELAIAGGVNLTVHPNKYFLLSKGGFASSDGRCQSFGEGGDGYVPGEGVGALLLKPLQAAESAGDQIYGVIKATAINHGGKAQGFTVPNPSSQGQVISQTYKNAGIDPRTVSYIEAHGTGTSLGDPVEISGLVKAFNAADDASNSRQYCAIGSIKSNIGHCESAAGVASITKVLLQFKHKKLAPSLHSETLNPYIDFSKSPFFVQRELADWNRPRLALNGSQEEKEYPRIAGISSFGAGGSNAHVVIQEHSSTIDSLAVPVAHSNQWIVLSAKTDSQLLEKSRQLLKFVSNKHNALTLDSLAYTLQVGRVEMETRLALIAISVDDLITKLETFIQGDSDEFSVNDIYSGTVNQEQSTLDNKLNLGGGLSQKSDIKPLLQQWVNGSSLDWNSLYSTTAPKRCSLPTYPFAQNRFWIDTHVDKNSGMKVEGRELPMAFSSFESLTQDVDQNSASSLNGGLQSKLQTIAAKIIKTEAEDIKPHIDLAKYGFESLSLTDFAEQISREFELELSVSELYEHTNIVSLSGYLQKNYPHIIQFFPIDEANGNVVKTSNSSLLKKELDHSDSSIAGHTKASAVKAHEPIAIIGMSGRFPMAENISQLWENLKSGKNSITEVPESRWNWRQYDDEPCVITGMSKMKWGGFLDQVTPLDPDFFDMSTEDAVMLNAAQGLMIQYAWKAIEDAGIKCSEFAQLKTGVFIGASPVVSQADSSYTLPTASLMPNRISYLLNLSGPSEYFDTACSSSLVAMHHAVKSIRNGECEQAIVGGINLLQSPIDFAGYDFLGMLSRDGLSRPFQDNANGFVQSEAVSAMVIKPLSAAQENNDHIYALIKGSGVYHGGSGMSFTAPNPRGIKLAMVEAYRNSAVSPSTVGYIEAHGASSAIADGIEFNALKSAYAEINQGLEGADCHIGSSKPCIGHGLASSGMLGIIKSVLSFQHEVKLGIMGFEQVNQYINLNDTPFVFAKENSEWPRLKVGGQELPRRAGISNLAIGGVNAHLVLEEYVEQAEVEQVAGKEDDKTWRESVVIFSAKNNKALIYMLKQTLVYLTNEPDLSVEDVAYTLQTGREEMNRRLAVVAADTESLKNQLQAFYQMITNEQPMKKGVAVYSNITEELLENPEFHEKSDNLDTSDGSYLVKMAKTWVSGQKVNWNKLPEKNAKRISFPSYPFVAELQTIEKENITLEIIERKNMKATGRNMEHSVVEILASTLSIDTSEINPDDSLKNLGLTSANFMVLLQKVQTLDPLIDLDVLINCNTVNEIASLSPILSTGVSSSAVSFMTVPTISTKTSLIATKRFASLKSVSVSGSAPVFLPHAWPEFPELNRLNKVNSGMPIFWIHGEFACIEPYRCIAESLERPFYAIEPRGWSTNDYPLNGVEEMALFYLHIIKTVQPEGPYDLAGSSFGGVVVCEMVRQLQELGDTVNSLVLINPINVALNTNITKQSLMLQAANHYLAEKIGPSFWSEEYLTISGIIREAVSEVGSDDAYLNELLRLISARLASSEIQVSDMLIEQRVKRILKIFSVNWKNNYSLSSMQDEIQQIYFIQTSIDSYYGCYEPYHLVKTDEQFEFNQSEYWLEYLNDATRIKAGNTSHFPSIAFDNSLAGIIKTIKKIYEAEADRDKSTVNEKGGLLLSS